MKKNSVNRDVIRQIEVLAKEAAFWASKLDKNSPKIDLTYSLKKNWLKDRHLVRQAFRYQPAP